LAQQRDADRNDQRLFASPPNRRTVGYC